MAKIILLLLSLLCAASLSLADSPPLPRYNLAVGTKYTYAVSPDAATPAKSHWELYVVQSNLDGSSRIIARQSPVDGGVVKVEQRTPPKSVYLDLFPDGRISWNNSIGF